MIVQTQGEELVLIRQTDHAVLCGFLAREWGNGLFVRPEPFESFCLAAREHDNGWSEWELEPEIDPRTRMPYSFMSIPTTEHIALYQHGIERLVKADHYAALLVSLHCSGLYDKARATMPGYSAKYVKSEESGVVNDFQQTLRLQQLRLKVDLRAKVGTKNYTEETTLQANLARLEALDRLSLYLCMAPVEPATIDGVPVDDQGSEADWEVRTNGNEISVSPYPFRKELLSVSILARRVPKRVYADDTDFANTLARAKYFPLNYTLRPGGALARSRIAVA